MDIKIICPVWGHEQLDIIKFLDKIRAAGYNGIETGLPEDKVDLNRMLTYLEKHEMLLIAHEYKAAGNSFSEVLTSYRANLTHYATYAPVLINSHTGRDYYTFEQNLALIDIAAEVSAKTGVTIAHETHRGRIGFSPFVMRDYFKARPGLPLTADLSHWVCVSESLLENFTAELNDAINCARHIHARVGYEEGPQVPDPRAPEWAYALHTALNWWDRIIELNAQNGKHTFTITTEFGPAPYMHTMPFTNQPVANQFEVNCFMKDLLKNRYANY